MRMQYLTLAAVIVALVTVMRAQHFSDDAELENFDHAVGFGFPLDENGQCPPSDDGSTVRYSFPERREFTKQWRQKMNDHRYIAEKTADSVADRLAGQSCVPSVDAIPSVVMLTFMEYAHKTNMAPMVYSMLAMQIDDLTKSVLDALEEIGTKTQWPAN